jgi:hypothetical protein
VFKIKRAYRYGKPLEVIYADILHKNITAYPVGKMMMVSMQVIIHFLFCCAKIESFLIWQNFSLFLPIPKNVDKYPQSGIAPMRKVV